MQGFINVNKPQGMTSASVVSMLKKQLHVDKIGHMGTLDPMASGVLPIAIGKATRLFDIALDKTKTYIAEFTFGYTTDTLDSTGLVLACDNYAPPVAEIKNACLSLIGTISQIPPKYSAKKVNGKCAYKLARAGSNFELKPKNVNILKFDLTKIIAHNVFEFIIVCSSGTYIRALARDLGELTKSLCIMSGLKRIQTGSFTINNSVNPTDVTKDDIISIDKAFLDFDRLDISDSQYKLISNGRPISIEKKLDNNTFVYYNNELLGLTKANSDCIKLDIYLKE